MRLALLNTPASLAMLTWLLVCAAVSGNLTQSPSYLCIYIVLSGLAAGMAIGIVGDAGVRAVGQQERLFVGMILILIFAEALGLYGLIVALILSQQSYECSA